MRPAKLPLPALLFLTTILTICFAVTGSAQALLTLGNPLVDRSFRSDNGPTNSQLTLDFTVTQAGGLLDILSWGQTNGTGGMSGIGESFELVVLRPLDTATNYSVVLKTPYYTVANTGTNKFAYTGTPVVLLAGDVVAHYGRGIPFDNNNGGPSSVYIASNLPEPVVGQTITVPGPIYTVYSDGGRTYSIQVQVASARIVTTTADGGAGSLRQAALDSAASGLTNYIGFATNLSGQTITLSTGPIFLTNVVVDGSTLANGVIVKATVQARLFVVTNGPTVTLNRLTLTNGFGFNNNNGGGAIYNAGNLAINSCNFFGNQAPGSSGGAIYNASNLTVNACSFVGNDASLGFGFIGKGGGAIYNAATLNALDCTFAYNTATNTTDGGGAILNESANATLNFCTVLGNHAEGSTHGGGGVLNIGSTASAVFNYYGSILCLNFNGNISVSGGSAVGAAASIAGGDPKLAALGYYGGFTPTMPPLPGSPAIDTGNNAFAGGVALDQRGHARISGTAPDAGAVEVDTNSIVTSTAVTATPGTLPYAITNVQPYDLIGFAPSLAGSVILLQGTPILLTNNVTIDGSQFTNGIHVDGNGQSRVFAIASNSVCTLTALTITNGVAGNPTYGGGIINYAQNSTLTVNRCTITGNYGPLEGGGVYNVGTTTLNECTIYGNSAGSGGGAGVYNDGLLTINQCTIIRNSNTNTTTGMGVVTYFGSLAMTNTLVAGNTSTGASTLQVVGGTINGNNNLTNTAPLMSSLGNFGGPTPTAMPLNGSPVFEVGNDATAALFLTDQRGYPRISGVHADVGAVEIQIATPFSIAGGQYASYGAYNFAITNIPGASFTVFASTNLSQPRQSWMNFGAMTENPPGSGIFNVTYVLGSSYPTLYFSVRSP